MTGCLVLLWLGCDGNAAEERSPFDNSRECVEKTETTKTSQATPPGGLVRAFNPVAGVKETQTATNKQGSRKEGRKMADEPDDAKYENVLETVFYRTHGSLTRRAFGGVVRAFLEAKAEDLGADIGGVVAAITWIGVNRFSKRYNLKLKPWVHGPMVLDVIAILIKEAERLADFTPGKTTFGARAAERGADAVFGGLIDGVRLSARAKMVAWNEEIMRQRRLLPRGQQLPWEKSREIIGESTFVTAQKLLGGGRLDLSGSPEPTPTAKADEPKIENSSEHGSEPTTKDPSRIDGMGEEVSIYKAFAQAEKDAADDPVVKLEVRAKRTILEGFQNDYPKESSALIDASVHGLVPDDRFMDALGLPDTFINDRRAPPDAPRQISVRAAALLTLAEEAEKRLKASSPARAPEEKRDKVDVEGDTDEEDGVGNSSISASAYAVYIEWRDSLEQSFLGPYWRMYGVPVWHFIRPFFQLIWFILRMIAWPFKQLVQWLSV